MTSSRKSARRAAATGGERARSNRWFAVEGEGSTHSSRSWSCSAALPRKSSAPALRLLRARRPAPRRRRAWRSKGAPHKRSSGGERADPNDTHGHFASRAGHSATPRMADGRMEGVVVWCWRGYSSTWSSCCSAAAALWPSAGRGGASTPWVEPARPAGAM